MVKDKIPIYRKDGKNNWDAEHTYIFDPYLYHTESQAKKDM